MDMKFHMCNAMLEIDWTAVAAIAAIGAVISDIVRRLLVRRLEGRAISYLIQPEIGDLSNYLYQAIINLEGNPENEIAWSVWADKIAWPVIQSVAPRLHVLSLRKLRKVTSLISKLTGVRRMIDFVRGATSPEDRRAYTDELVEEMKGARKLALETRLTKESKLPRKPA